MAKKVAVILGAGASYDCWNDTGSPARPEWRPPLARELFGARPSFWDVLRKHHGVMILASELGELARGDAFNVEVKLREYASHKDQRIRNHFKEVPLYLRDLIIAVMRSYTDAQIAGTHIRLVMSLLATGANVAFIDLNYDSYIETALVYFDRDLAIRAIPEYVDLSRQAIVCKVHGSIDWAVRMGAPGHVGWHPAFLDFDPQRRPLDIVLDKRRRSSAGWSAENDGAPLYPLLTAPLAGKGHLDLVCPDQHLKALREFLRDCGHYLIIGTSGQDEDLLAFLREVKRTSKRPIVYYVSDSDSNARVTADRMGDALQAASGTLFGGGFRQYVDSTMPQDMLKNLE